MPTLDVTRLITALPEKMPGRFDVGANGIYVSVTVGLPDATGAYELLDPDRARALARKLLLMADEAEQRRRA